MYNLTVPRELPTRTSVCAEERERKRQRDRQITGRQPATGTTNRPTKKTCTMYQRLESIFIQLRERGKGGERERKKETPTQVSTFMLS